jgi:hypothetical protein
MLVNKRILLLLCLLICCFKIDVLKIGIPKANDAEKELIKSIIGFYPSKKQGPMTY